MKFIRTFALAFTMAFAAVSGLFFTSAAFAGNETNVSSGLTIKGKPLAVHGYDVVAYFTVGRPTVGNSKFSVVHKDATYRFASQANVDAFKADPDKFLPQYGGFCAYGVAVGGKFDGDPQLWRIVDGKLYLNLNQKIQNEWQSDIPGYIKKADRNWRSIATKAPAELS
ncbi:MAG: hypothetical protein MJE12_26450 [Alphaproteobacteria bacterium]|nr:hypothetical protein [Alphaproteobacteria bacterium]